VRKSSKSPWVPGALTIDAHHPSATRLGVRTRRLRKRVVDPLAARAVRSTLAGSASASSEEGPGLPEAVRARRFEPCVSSARSSGLGLFVCRSIVEVHGGRLEATPHEGSGTFYPFSFPRTRPAS
jgi:signal transduction histidine kinase